MTFVAAAGRRRCRTGGDNGGCPREGSEVLELPSSARAEQAEDGVVVPVRGALSRWLACEEGSSPVPQRALAVELRA